VNSHRIRSVVAIGFSVMVQAGCDHGPKIGPPEKITRIGDGQTGTVGTVLPVRPAVRIQDANERGVPGVAVTFNVSSGKGIVTGGAVQTDETGTATLGNWTLGTTIGVNTLVAVASGVPGSPVSFSAAATAGPVVALTKVGMDPVSAPVGGNIDSVVVRAADQFGNPVAGETITFTVTRGAGSVSPALRTTLADGRAAARWTLGPDVDSVNTVVAARSDGSLPVTFTTVAAPAIATVRLADRILLVDSLATITPSVSIRDQDGDAIPGGGISLVTRAPGVASAGTTTVTGVKGGQTFLVAAASDNPAVSDSALVIVGNPGAPVVRITMPGFDLKTDTTFTVSLIVDMRGSAITVGASTLNLVWNPAALTFVSEAAGALGDVAINSAAAATGFMSLAFAREEGVGGVIEVRQVTFRTSATPGRSGTLTANVVDMSAGASDGFANLAPRTVSGIFPMRTR
jgi:adhesin/invasin